jgi:hypothetical protein
MIDAVVKEAVPKMSEVVAEAWLSLSPIDNDGVPALHLAVYLL